MNKAELKRKQARKVIIVEILMVIAVVVGVGVFMFIVLGYKFSSDGTIDQSGLLQVKSTPTGATVTIDDEVIFAKTDTSKMLSEGEHTVRLTKDGYELWEKTITIQSGLLYKLDYPRLFKQGRKQENVKNFDKKLEFLTAAPSRTNLLYAEEGETVWNVMSTRGDDTVTNKIEVAEYFRGGGEAEGDDSEDGEGADDSDGPEPEFEGKILGMEWNKNGDKVLVEWRDDMHHDFVLLDVKNVKESLNLTEEFGMEFSDVKMASDLADQLLVLENGNLRKISIGDKAISKVLISGVDEFYNDEMTIIYASKVNDKGARKIGLYKDGEASVLTEVEGEKIKLVLSEYLGESYVAMVVNREMRIYRGMLPTVEEDLSVMEEVMREDLGVTPKEFYAHADGRMLIAENGGKMDVFDAELTALSQFTLRDAEFSWLDEFLIGDVEDGKLVARDFDGTNARELAEATDGYDAVISANGKWLYYVTNNGMDLQRERL